MNRELRRGYLEIETTAPRFGSPLSLLADSVRLYLARLGLIVSITVLVYLPGHLLYQFGAAAMEVPSNGVLSIVLMEVLDIVLAALVTPALVYGLVHRQRVALGECMRWGSRQWMRTLRQQMLVEVTVLLYGALLIVPGIIAMMRLAFVAVIVAIEGDRQDRPLERSRQLAKSHLWRIFGVFLPLTMLDLAANFLLLDHVPTVDTARVLFAVAETGLAVITQLGTVASLLMYLGLIEVPRRQPGKSLDPPHSPR